MATSGSQRVVVLVDMDCFYVQVAQRKDPSIKGKPCAVVQYNTWRGGGIIAVSYEARKFGVTRQMRGDEAKKKCPDITFVPVPENRGKADLTQFREACVEVMEVLAKFTVNLERASVDEAYMDLTDEISKSLQEYTATSVALETLKHSHLIGLQTNANHDLPLHDDQLKNTNVFKQWKSVLETSAEAYRLAIGAVIANRMRKAVAEELGFTCSAGIGPNKMLAKIVAGFNKPNQQTLVLPWDVPEMFKTTKMRKIRHLGGKLGAQLEEKLRIEYMSDLLPLTLQQLQAAVGIKPGGTVYWLCRGVDEEPVRPRQLPQSIGCGKNFRGKLMLKTTQDVQKWLSNLCEEVVERLEKDKEQNNRVPTLFTVGCTNKSDVSQSRRCQVVKYTVTELCDEAYRSLCDFNNSKTGNNWTPALINLNLTASKFVDAASYGRIKSYMVPDFKKGDHSTSSSKHQEELINSSKLTDANDIANSKSGISNSDTPNKTMTVDDEKTSSYFCSTKRTSESENQDGNPTPTVTREQRENSRDLSTYFHKNSSECVDGSDTVEQDKQPSLVPKQQHENHKMFSSFFKKNSTKSEPVRSAIKSPEFCHTVNSSKITETSNVQNNRISPTKPNLESSSIVINEPSHNKERYLPESPIPGGKFKKERQTLFERFLKPVVIAKVQYPTTTCSNNSSNRDDNFDAVNRHKVQERQSPVRESGLSKLWNSSSLDYSSHESHKAIDYYEEDSSKTVSTTTLNDIMTCERCGKRLLAWDLPDHMDFHFAQDLRDSIRQGGQRRNASKDSNKRNSLSQNDHNNIHSPSRKRLKASTMCGSSLTNYFSPKKKE